MKRHCNLWRNWDHIQDSYQSLRYITDYFAGNQSRIQPHAGPGHWNDPDMLLIGNYGLTIDQSKTQMAIWAILAAPLIMSNDLDAVRSEFKDILLNKYDKLNKFDCFLHVNTKLHNFHVFSVRREVIKVNQDPMGIQGTRVIFDRRIEVICFMLHK